MNTGSAMDTRFRATRLRAGYDADEVDAFIEVVEDALSSPAPSISAADVAWQRFRSVLLRTGYHREDVDHYLTEAEHLLGERERWS